MLSSVEFGRAAGLWRAPLCRLTLRWPTLCRPTLCRPTLCRLTLRWSALWGPALWGQLAALRWAATVERTRFTRTAAPW